MKNKGFTLVEVTIATLFLGILLISVWSFFSTMYINYLQLENSSKMQDQARLVKEFITESIDQANEVKIEIDTPTGLQTITGKKSSTDLTMWNTAIPEGKLKVITLDGGTNGSIELSGANLYYRKGAGSNEICNIISTEPNEGIYVSKDANSDMVTFRCNLREKRKYRLSNPDKIHQITSYIKVSLQYKK